MQAMADRYQFGQIMLQFHIPITIEHQGFA
jgi:hypothetical protein